MKNQILLGVFGLLLPTTLTAQTLQHTIKGSIKNGKANGMVYLIKEQAVADSVFLKNGSFQFTASLKDPGEALIMYDHGKNVVNVMASLYDPKADYIKIFLAGGETSLAVTDSLRYAKVSGGPRQEEYLVYRKTLAPIEKRSMALMAQFIKFASITPEQAKDTAFMAKIKIDAEKFKKDQEQVKLDEWKAKEAYAKAKPTSYFTLSVLKEMLQNQYRLSEVKAWFEGMDNNLRESKPGKEIAAQIQKMMENDPTWVQNIDLDKRILKLFDDYAAGSEEQKRTLVTEYHQLADQRKQTQISYVKANPDSPYSINIIQGMLGDGYDKVKPLFAALSPKAQASENGKKIADRLEVLQRSKTGQKMIDFTQQDQHGKDVRWADFKGKYVFVDFWASWCGPCRAENPNVLKAYNNYKDKNFTVIGISLDENAESWKGAIEQDKMPWIQVSQLNGFKNEVSTYYGVQSIPSSLLVDPEGNIIAQNLRGEQLHTKLKEILK